MSRDDTVSRFLSNGYPRSFISNVIRMYDRRKKQPRHPVERFDKRVFIRVPFVGEAHKRRCLALLHRSGLSEHVNVWFDGGKSLRRIFHPPKEHIECTPKCSTCPSNDSKFPQCYRKNVIYQIVCGVCSKIYIGETCRTVYLRIREHMNVNNNSSAVIQHFTSEHVNDIPVITWKVLCYTVASTILLSV